MERIKLNINLNHPRIPPIFGFDSGKTGYEVLEIRKINFEPVPLTNQTLTIITTYQLFKIIDQIIDFFNYILNLELSITLLTLDDLFSVSYLDNGKNIYFGDLSFIENRNNLHKSLYSLGIIIYQLLGGEISFEENHAIRKFEINEEIPFFWKQFILTCIDEKIDIENFYSPLMLRNKDNFLSLFLSDEAEDNVLDLDEHITENNMTVGVKNFIKEISIKDLINQYKELIYNNTGGNKDERFTRLNAETKEDGKIVFIECATENLHEKMVSKFLMQVGLNDPMLLPLKGFSFTDTSYKAFYFYRETEKQLFPFNYDTVKYASDERRINWIKQLAHFVSYLNEGTNCKITRTYFIECTALDENNDLIFVNLTFLDLCTSTDDQLKINIKGFWNFMKSIVNENNPFKINFPIRISKIFSKDEDSFDYKDFRILKDYVENFDPNIDSIELEVEHYLEDYEIENEIKGHQCLTKIYKRSLFSSKKFRRLVLKKYNCNFTEKQKNFFSRIKSKEKCIIEYWATNRNESFILMKYIKAQRLKDLIPELEYEQKIIILKNIAEIIEKYLFLIIFGNLSINNIYIAEYNQVKFLDCIFITDNCDDPLLTPETKHSSSLKHEEKEKIDIYSLGIIAYEMFGKSFNYQEDFNFENVPPFIEYFVRVCSNPKSIERPSICNVIQKLKRYQDQDVPKLFQNELVEVSSYFINQDDLYKPSIGRRYDVISMKSTKVMLIQKCPSVCFGETGIERMRAYIQAYKCTNGLQVSGFTIDDDHYSYYYKYWNDFIDIDSDPFIELEKDIKMEVFKDLSLFYAEMTDLGYQVSIIATEMMFDSNKKAKFSPGLSFDEKYDVKEEIEAYYGYLINAFGGDRSKKIINPETPLLIQALIRHLIYNKETTFKQISNVFNPKISEVNNEIDWNVEGGNISNDDEYFIYKAEKNPEIVEEGIRVEILTNNSNLFSYSKKEASFALYYHGKCDFQFKEYLYDLENLSINASIEKARLKDFKVDHVYKGSHCLVEFLTNGEEKLVLKKYYEKYDKIECYYGIWGVDSHILKESDELIILQEYEGVETLEDCFKRGDDFINEDFITELVYLMIKYHKYTRFSPHNICISLKDKEIKIVDTIQIDQNNYGDFKDEFVAPELSALKEMTIDDIKSAAIYSAGWIAYTGILFGFKPEIDTISKRFKAPSFNEHFSQFWKDFITLATRENTYDRPIRKYLMRKLESESPFEDFDFIHVSSKLLNHDDYIIEDPIGAGGESIIYLATNKITGEKHACKKLKYKIRSIEIKKILQSIDNLDSSIYGIKYLGISLIDNVVYLHMEYVPNGSLSEIINLDRRMSAPSWFRESAKLRIAREIAEGMRSLHEHGVIHKDLKPENILLDEDNKVKICDFSFIQEDGAMTPLFMAPELFKGEEATAKSDVYSYAVTLAALYGGGEMIGSVKTAASGGFRPSIAVGTPLLIQNIIRKCWKQNPDDRPTFSEIVDEFGQTNPEDFNMKIDSMTEFPNFDINIPRGELSDDYEYEICEITGDPDDVEHYIRLCITIQPDNVIHIHKYCKIENKFVLVIEKCEKTTLYQYLNEKKIVSRQRGEKYISDFISLFELYHKNKFYFGPFSLKRIFFRDKHRSSICFDLFSIDGLERPPVDEDVLIKPPESYYSREGDIYAFACFILKIFDCFTLDKDGNVSRKPFKRSSRKEKQPIPFKYQNIIIERCLSKDPMTRPRFELLFQKLFPVQYKIISTFLSVSISRFSTFSMKTDFNQEEIVFMETIGSGSFGKVVHAYNKTNDQDLAVKEFNDKIGDLNTDFMLEYVALKTIDHPNIVKILGASQRKESVHGSRLYMEFASNGDLDKNMNEPLDVFIIHLYQISSAMKYLHQRSIIHFDLKPKNILIRGDGSAAVADFNTAMHVDIDTHLKNHRGSENYMSPEIMNMEKYSFQTDIYSYGMMAAEYFSPDAHRIIREFNKKHEHPVLDFIDDKDMRSLIEFCVDDDPMSRPSFAFICNYLFTKFIKSNELEELNLIPRIDEDKLNQLRILSSRGSNEAILEYGKYLLLENSFTDAMYIYLKGANNDEASCKNTVGVLSMTDIAESIVERPIIKIMEAADQDDKFGLTNSGCYLYQNENSPKDTIELLERAYSKGVTFAGYLLGLVYEKRSIDGMTVEERLKKAMNLYHDCAKDGDPFAQYKYGLCLEEGLIEDEDGHDCVHYFRQSAYQRCRKGCSKYSKFIEGNRKEYYQSLKKLLPKGESRYLWDNEQDFFDEMMSCHTGMMLFDANSRERFDFLSKNIFYCLHKE